MKAYVIYVNNYYRGLNLTKDISNKEFNFTFNYKTNKPSWFFADGLYKDLSKHKKINKFICWVYKEKDIVTVCIILLFISKVMMDIYIILNVD